MEPQSVEKDIQLSFYKPVAFAGLAVAFLTLVLGSDVSATNWPTYAKYVIICFAVFTAVVYFTSGYYQAQLRRNQAIGRKRSVRGRVIGVVFTLPLFALAMRFLADQSWEKAIIQAIGTTILLEALEWFTHRKPKTGAPSDPPLHSA